MIRFGSAPDKSGWPSVNCCSQGCKGVVESWVPGSDCTRDFGRYCCWLRRSFACWSSGLEAGWFPWRRLVGWGLLVVVAEGLS